MVRSSRQSRVRGFSLLEVLISMLLLAFGVIAMGGLQLATLRSNQTAAFSAVAAGLAKDYSEMMRTNQSISNNTSTVAGVNPYLFDTSDTTTFAAPTTICTTATCTTADIATQAVYDWGQRVQAQLPQGRAVVCRDATPRNSNGTFKWACDNLGTVAVIKLGWVDRRDAQEKQTSSFAVSAPLLVITGVTGYAE
jgi:type IV pilus assembly protein PilV